MKRFTSTSSFFEERRRGRSRPTRAVIGDKVRCRRRSHANRELLGLDHFIMRCQWPALPREQVLGSIQRLGEDSDQAVQTRAEQLGGHCHANRVGSQERIG